MIYRSVEQIDFDYQEFREKAQKNHFHGQVIQHWKDGKLVLLTVSQSLQIKDFYKALELSNEMI